MFLVCGEALFDLFVEPGPEEDSELRLRGVAGGSPFNLAVGLARLGVAVGLSTEISADPLGQRLRERLAVEGIAADHVRETSAPTPLALVGEDKRGRPSYAFHGLSGGAYGPIGRLDGITGLHIGSAALASPRSAEHLLDLARRFEHGLVSLDPNIRLAVEPRSEVWRDAFQAFAAHAHLIKLSSDDLEALYGVDADVEGLASHWLGGTCRLVVVTRAEQGASLFTIAGRIDVPAAPSRFVDSVGAGDSFQAAMLAWIIDRRAAGIADLPSFSEAELREMSAFAARAAAITCSRRGPDLPTRADIHS